MNRRELLKAITPISPLLLAEAPKPSDLNRAKVYLFVINDVLVTDDSVATLAEALAHFGIRGTFSWSSDLESPAFTIYELDGGDDVHGQ